MTKTRLIEQFNLRSRLRFNVEQGEIWLDENRMLLFHAARWARCAGSCSTPSASSGPAAC
jgi:hypothetical protein